MCPKASGWSCPRLQFATGQVSCPRQPAKGRRCRSQAPNLSAARAFALAASSSRFFGGALVSSEWRRRAEIAATSSTAARNEASLALDGLLKPVIFLTNCSEAARTSSALTGGSKLKRVLIFLHIQHDLQQHEFLVCHIDRSWKIVLEQPPD